MNFVEIKKGIHSKRNNTVSLGLPYQDLEVPSELSYWP